MTISSINLDLTARLRDHEFAVEYVKALEEQQRDCDKLSGARIAELEAALREMQKSVPGGTNCDPQQVADTLREIAGKVGVKIID